VAYYFGDAHVGNVFSADDAGLAGGFHLRAAEAGEGGLSWEGLGDAGAQLGDDLGAVVVARGLAGGEEDARVGSGGDRDEFSGSRGWGACRGTCRRSCILSFQYCEYAF
jgi:hypothetical protein